MRCSRVGGPASSSKPLTRGVAGGGTQPVKTHFYYRLTPGSHALAGAVQSGIHKAVIAAGAASCPAGVGSCAADSAPLPHLPHLDTYPTFRIHPQLRSPRGCPNSGSASALEHPVSLPPQRCAAWAAYAWLPPREEDDWAGGRVHALPVTPSVGCQQLHYLHACMADGARRLCWRGRMVREPHGHTG